MKIGIDISMLVYQGSGVATYTYNFVKTLLKIDTENEYKLFYSSLRRPKNFYYLDSLQELGAKIYSYYIPPRLLKLWWNKFHIFPIELLIGKVDVFHSSDYLRPPFSPKAKGITTLHDLTWKKFPEFHTSDVIKAHENKLRKTIKFGDIIMTDSMQTRKDLLHYYPEIDEDKVFVNYPGIDDRFKPIRDKEEIKKILEKYGLEFPKKYLLYVGAIEPRKNLETSINIFSKLISQKIYQDFEFLIVGRAGWKNENIFQQVKQLKLQEKVKFVGFVEDADLPYFYNAAKVCIYLSLYEGFGLPPLEAAKCLVPILVYSNSSLIETIPLNYPVTKAGEELSRLIQLIKDRIIIDPKYLEKFSWDYYCQKFLDIINIH